MVTVSKIRSFVNGHLSCKPVCAFLAAGLSQKLKLKFNTTSDYTLSLSLYSKQMWDIKDSLFPPPKVDPLFQCGKICAISGCILIFGVRVDIHEICSFLLMNPWLKGKD